MSSINDIIDKYRPSLDSYEELYKWLHANPELSFMERETAAVISKRLEKFGTFVVKSGIGGHGVAAVMTNGDGPTVLLRGDFDALPVKEQTGLPYASTKRMTDHEGATQPVMHACGHDMHVSCLLSAAELLVSARDTWSGTLILAFQPAEEKGYGAQAMVDDGLYTRHGVPIPDVVLGGHVFPSRSGYVGAGAGAFMATADSLRIGLHGSGGHGSAPHRTIDPVIMAAYTITRLQTIVSRETAPADHAVVTVATVHAGVAENVISDSAELKVNVRTFDETVRKRILGSVERIVRAESEAGNAVKPPTFSTISSYPLTSNDAGLHETLSKTFAARFGDKYDPKCPRVSGSEDFTILGSAVDRPTCYWVYGGADPEVWDRLKSEGKLDEIPFNHSPFFAPVIHPTMQTGLESYAVAALTWLLKK